MKTICAPDNVACMVDNFGHDATGPTIVFVAMLVAIAIATYLKG